LKPRCIRFSGPGFERDTVDPADDEQGWGCRLVDLTIAGSTCESDDAAKGALTLGESDHQSHSVDSAGDIVSG